MSTQSALDFIQYIRSNTDQFADLIARQETGFQALIRMGKQQGFEFAHQELSQAFKWDWMMRAHNFCNKQNNTPSQGK